MSDKTFAFFVNVAHSPLPVTGQTDLRLRIANADGADAGSRQYLVTLIQGELWNSLIVVYLIATS